MIELQRYGKAVIMEYVEQTLGAALLQQAQDKAMIQNMQARIQQLEAALAGSNVVPFVGPTPE